LCAKSVLDDLDYVKNVDKSGMLSLLGHSAENYSKSAELVKRNLICNFKPRNIIISGMGGSAIGGELLKDWAKSKAGMPVEVCRDYFLPEYADRTTLVFINSYSGETEESLSALLDSVRRKCRIICISSGGRLLEFAEKLGLNYVRVPSGMPPRAALPFMFIPLLIQTEKFMRASDVEEEISEAIEVVGQVSIANSPQKSFDNNFSKKLASEINGTIPTTYGFGIFRGAAQRFKQQFNENSKVHAKWEYFSELDHNEIVGWEDEGLSACFSTIYIRDKKEPREIRLRIETTRKLVTSTVKAFEVWSQGTSDLSRMLSVICIGDFVSVYLAILRGVDPTPVKNISTLKQRLEQGKARLKIIKALQGIIK
jgi:glucose/mannose-6-phosphate isomerase